MLYSRSTTLSLKWPVVCSLAEVGGGCVHLECSPVDGVALEPVLCSRGGCQSMFGASQREYLVLYRRNVWCFTEGMRDHLPQMLGASLPTGGLSEAVDTTGHVFHQD